MEKETDMLDLNQPTGDSSSSNSPIQLHNFMPMPFLTSHDNQDEYDGDSGFMFSLKENMLQFWNERMTEISNASDLRSQILLPLARVKRMIKSDAEVKLVSRDAPILVAKAIELFILELTLRAWLNTQNDHRQTLHGYDVARAIRHEELLALLLSDVVHEHLKGESNHPTEIRLAYQLHLQNMNAQEEANCPKETELQLACPDHLPNVYTGNPEFLELFPISLSSVPSNHSFGAVDMRTRKPEFVEQLLSPRSSKPSNKDRPGSELAFHTSEQEFLEALPSLISSLPSNYCPGSEAFYIENPDIAKFPSSASSLPSDYFPKSE